MLRIYDPTVEPPEVTETKLVPRLETLAGKRIGVVWNNKQPGEYLLREMQRRLVAEYGAIDGPLLMKPYLGNVAPDEILDELAKCDAVVSGIGDCGSCMSATVLDAIMMERRGVPAVAVGTERLAMTTGVGMARFHSVPDFPIAILHGRARLEGVNNASERDHVVDEFLPQVVKALLTGRAG